MPERESIEMPPDPNAADQLDIKFTQRYIKRISAFYFVS